LRHTLAMADEVHHLELRHDGVHKFWHAERDAATVTTRTGKVGNKGRTYTKDHGDPAKAEAALAKALRRKFREGFVPAAGEGESGARRHIPSPAVNDAGIAADDRIRVAQLVSKKREFSNAARNRPPAEFVSLRRKYGYDFVDGPTGTNLWFPKRGGAIEVLLGHFSEVRPFEPHLAIVGDYHECVPLWFRGHPIRDDRYLALGLGSTLWELDMHEAGARVLLELDSVAELRALLPLVYVQGKPELLGLRGQALVHVRAGEVETLLELDGTAPIDLVGLCGDQFAILQRERLTILRLAADGGAPVISHAIDCRSAFALGAVDGGRLLFVFSEGADASRTVSFAVGEDQLWEVSRSRKPWGAAYDARGHAWIELGKSGPRQPARLCNLEAARAKAMRGEPVAGDHATERSTLIDVIITALDNRNDLGLDYVRSQLGGRLDERASFGVRHTALTYALWRKAKDIATLLIDAGADPNAVSNDGVSALGWAYRHNLLRQARQLLDAGAQPNLPASVEIDGREVRVEPPLVAAARGGVHDEVIELLDRGADIDACDGEGHTALSMALAKRDGELARVLLERGASTGAAPETLLDAAVRSEDVDLLRRVGEQLREQIRGPIGTKLLRSAALTASVTPLVRELPKILLELGATSQAEDTFHYIIECREPELVNMMLAQGADARGRYVTANKPHPHLHLALFCKPVAVETIRALLDAGADPAALDNRGIPPLRYAVANAPAEVVQLLLERGAPVERGDSAWAPLHEAAWQGKADAATLLLDAGAEIDATTADGRTPLAMAAEKDRAELVELLLERGAAIDGGRFTALMAAARGNHEAIVQRLLDAGADPTREGTSKDSVRAMTALDHARAAGAAKARRVLEEAGGEISLVTALARDDLEIARAHLDAGEDVNARLDDRGTTALHLARSRAMIELLVERGALVEASDRWGNTPIMLAAAASDDAQALARVEALLDAGATVATKGKQTALHRAASAGNPSTLRRLLAAGAKNRNRGTTPLHLAAGRGELECVRILLAAGAKPVVWDNGEIAGRKTPLHLAAAGNHVEVMAALLGAGASPGDHRDPEDYDWGGRTPIHDAAAAGHVEALRLLVERDRTGAVHLPTNRHRYADDEAGEHAAAHAFLRAVMDGASVSEYDAQTRKAEAATAAKDAERGFWTERIQTPASPMSPKLPPAIAEARRGYQDVVVMGPSREHALVFWSERGKSRLACADLEGIHSLDDAPTTSDHHCDASYEGARFLATDTAAVYEVDAAARSWRKILDSEAEIEDVGYAGELVLVRRGERWSAFGRDGAHHWTLDGSGIYKLLTTGTKLVAVVPWSYVLGAVWCVADERGLFACSYLDVQLERIWSARDEQGRTRTFAMGVHGENWEDEHFLELHNLAGAEAGGEPLADFAKVRTNKEFLRGLTKATHA
jgi:ankyrin repeat protein/predicted DNA-binding WGR domain protein